MKIRHYLNRDKKGRFARNGILRFFNKVYKLTAIILIIMIFATWVGLQARPVVYARNVVSYQRIDNLTPKIEELKGEVLDTLHQCESSGVSDEVAIINHNDGGSASYGQYQFKRDTVKHYYKTLYGEEITNKQAILVALDGQKSRELAKDIIFETDKGIKNWSVCNKRHGLSDRIEIINKLNE